MLSKKMGFAGISHEDTRPVYISYLDLVIQAGIFTQEEHDNWFDIMPH